MRTQLAMLIPKAYRKTLTESEQTYTIAKFTGLKPDEIEKFVIDNKLSMEKLLYLATHCDLNDKNAITNAVTGTNTNDDKNYIIGLTKKEI